MHTTTPTETPQEIRVTGHMPVLAGLLLTSLLLGLTWRHWMEENKASHNRRQQAFTAAVDRNTYSIRDRMATLAMMLRGVKAKFEAHHRVHVLDGAVRAAVARRRSSSSNASYTAPMPPSPRGATMR